MQRGRTRRYAGVGVALLTLPLCSFTAPPVKAAESAIVITIKPGKKVMEAIREALPLVLTFDLLTGDVVLEFEEGWATPDPTLECVHVSPELDLTVRVMGREDGDLTGEGPTNVKLPGFVVKPESSGSGGAVRLQDVDLTGFCVQPPDSDGVTSRARLVVSGDREVTLIDVGIENDDFDAAIDRSYGLFATNGTITAYSLNTAGFTTGFAVKLTDAAVAFTQTGGVYTQNTGGALASLGATVTLSEVDFGSGDLTTGRAIYAEGGTLTLHDVDFVGSEAGDSGGSIYTDGSTLTLTEGSFSLSSASGNGGAIYATGGSNLTLTDVIFDVTVSSAHGGAIYADGSKLALDGVSFAYNTASADGGAIYADEGSLTLSGVSFEGNVAGGDGGAIYAQGGTADLSDVSFVNDLAGNSGGAIALSEVWSFSGCGLTFTGSRAYSYGGAISAADSEVTLDAGDDGACGPNVFWGVRSPLGAALSLSQHDPSDPASATLSWLELSQIKESAAISSSLLGGLTLTDVTTPGALGGEGLLRTDPDSEHGKITAARLHVRGGREPLPNGESVIAVSNASLTLTESTFCGLAAGPSAAPMISITDSIDNILLQRNTIWGGWSELSESALIAIQNDDSTTKYTPYVRVIDNTLIGSGFERGVTTDESVTYWGVNNLFNDLAVGQQVDGEVEWLSHNLYGETVYVSSIGAGAVRSSDELIGERPRLLRPLSNSCADLPLLRPTSPAVGAGPEPTDTALWAYNEALTYNGVPYNSLDDIGAQPVEPAADKDGDGFTVRDDCDDADEHVNPDAEELPGNGLDDDCDPNTSDDVLDADQDGDGVPDAEDCAPSDPAIAEDCASTHTVYTGGRAGCGVAPRPLGLMGVVLAFAFTRRRGSAISRV